MALKKRLARLESNPAFMAKSEHSVRAREHKAALIAYFGRRTTASTEFCLLHDREPLEGDVLAYDEIHNTTGVDWLDWHLYVDRSVAREPLVEGQEEERDGYRLKVEGQRIYRTLTTQEERNLERCQRPPLWSPVQDTGWWVLILCNPEARWRRVEEDAMGLELGWHHPTAIPTVPMMTFLGVVDGKHKCTPATDAEFPATRNQTR